MPDSSASGNGFGSRPEDINRSGRPSPVADFRALVLAALERKRGGKVLACVLIDKLVALAVAGDLEAARLVLLYAYGRPRPMTEAGDPLGGLAEAVARITYAVPRIRPNESMSEFAARGGALDPEAAAKMHGN